MKTIINTYFRLLITSLVQNIFKKNTILFSTTLFLLCFNISQAQTDIINEFSSENYSYSTVKNSTNNDGNSTYSIREILATSSDDELSSEIYNTLKKGKKAFSKDIKQIVTTPSFHSIVKEKFLSLISTQKQSFKNIFTHLSTIFVDSDGD
jgi:type III secretory pathway component EscR